MHGLDELWAELDRRTDYESCRRPRGARFDLEGMRSLLARLGDPQAAAPAIHVAGSKGKGTTCHYLEKGLRAAGLRTGLYTSPHLTSWRERICIGGDEADDATVAGALEKVLAASRGNETFFDLLTATAFVAFAERDCAAWVVEVGLGGRFDSTNLLQPLAAAVVSIEAEHVDVFGSDPCAIAVEKAGIFKTGARLWSGLVRGHAARGVLLARARELGGELLELPDAAPGRADLPQPQAHSRRDFALARAMLADLGAHGHDACVVAAKALDTLPAGALRLPGRWELGTTEDGRPVVFDVAHTPASIAAVLGAFRRAWPQARRGIVMGLRADKDLAAVRAAIGPPQAGEAWFACHAGDHPLSADPLAVAAAFGAQPLARPELPPGPEVLLVTGSSYLVGLLRARRAAPALQ